ncbi:hypothetical protein [Bradyrhizobium sp. UFLA05-112]
MLASVSASSGAQPESVPTQDKDLLTELITVSSISALLGIQKPSGIVQVLGYYNPGDGGGGIFAWKSESKETTDLGLVFRTAHSEIGRWHRQWSGALDVRWFGAIGDGRRDCTESLADCLSKTSQKVLSGEWTSIKFPSGVYCIRDGIHFRMNRTRLIGEYAVIRQQSEARPIFILEGAEWSITGLRFEWEQQQPPTAINAYALGFVGDTWDFLIQDCHFSRGYRAISTYLEGDNNPLVWGGAILNCRVRNFQGSAVHAVPRRRNAGQLSLSIIDLGVFNYFFPSIEPHIQIWDCEVFLAHLDLEGEAPCNIALEQCYGSISAVHIEHKKQQTSSSPETTVLKAERCTLSCEGWTNWGRYQSYSPDHRYHWILAYRSEISIRNFVNKGFSVEGPGKVVAFSGSNSKFEFLGAPLSDIKMRVIADELYDFGTNNEYLEIQWRNLRG